jgi:hypothetical protein
MLSRHYFLRPPECRLRVSINLGGATIRHGADKKTHLWKSIVKITGLIGLVRPLLFLVFQNKNVTGEIVCRSLAIDAQKAQSEQHVET